MIDSSRKLGEQERMMHYTHGFGALIPVQVMHIRGVIATELIAEGLAWLQHQHVMLRAHVRYGEVVMRRASPYIYRQPYLETVGTGPILLEEVTAPWEEVFMREMRRPLKRGRAPRIRFVIVRDPADPGMTRLVVAADHAFFDGPAAFVIDRDLLEYLADPAKMRDRPPQSEHLPPPLDLAQPKKPNSGKRGYEPALRLPPQKVKGGRRRTRVLSRQLGRDDLDGLRQAIVANRATMHGAVAAAFLLAMHERYGLKAMTCLSSVDLRRLCTPPLPHETMGCYIDLLRTTHVLGNDYWAMARDVSFKLITTLAKDQEIASFTRMPDMEVYRAEFWPTVTHNRRLDGLGVTTAGESGLRTVYGNHVLEGVTMATSVDLFGPGLLVLAAERDGALDLSICYSEDALPAGDAAGMADRALALLARQEALVTPA